MSSRRAVVIATSCISSATSDRYLYIRARRGKSEDVATPDNEVMLNEAASRCPRSIEIDFWTKSKASENFFSDHKIRTDRLSNQLSTSREEAAVRNPGAFSEAGASTSMEVSLPATSSSRPAALGPSAANKTLAAEAMSATVAFPEAPEAVPSQRRTTFAGFVYVCRILSLSSRPPPRDFSRRRAAAWRGGIGGGVSAFTSSFSLVVASSILVSSVILVVTRSQIQDRIYLQVFPDCDGNRQQVSSNQDERGDRSVIVPIVQRSDQRSVTVFLDASAIVSKSTNWTKKVSFGQRAGRA
jgi:hypothetical protein